MPLATDAARRDGTGGAADGRRVAAERLLAATVALDGYHVVAIAVGHAPALAYTVGLWATAAHPELAVAGLEPTVAAQLLHLLAGRVVAGGRYAPGERLTGLLAHHALAFRDIEAGAAATRLRVAARFHAPGGFAALQVLWPDPASRCPAEAGCAAPQPPRAQTP